MHRQHVWKITPLILMASSMAWWAHAQVPTQVSETRDTGTATIGLSSDLDLSLETAATVTSAPVNWIGYGEQGVEKSTERELEKHTRDLLKDYRSSSDTGVRSVVKETLTAVITEHFKLRQTAREKELQNLAEELNRLKALHDKRQNQQDKIVAARVESLLRDADGLGWGSSSSKQSYTGGTGDAIWTYGSKTNGSGGRRRDKLETFPSEALPTPRPQ